MGALGNAEDIALDSFDNLALGLLVVENFEPKLALEDDLRLMVTILVMQRLVGFGHCEQTGRDGLFWIVCSEDVP